MKNTEKWFGDLLDSYKDDFDFRLETIIFEITEQISKKLKDSNISQKQLAEKLGIKPSAVSKILNGKSNFTLRTLLTLADALKVDLSVELKDTKTVPAEVSFQPQRRLMSILMHPERWLRRIWQVFHLHGLLQIQHRQATNLRRMMKINKIYKSAIISEVKYVQKKMKESKGMDKKLFYYSAIPAEFLRVLNMEYDINLLYLHHVVNHAYSVFQQRMLAIRSGDTTVMITEEQINKLEGMLDDLILVLEQKKSIDDVMKAFIELAYSSTGNGYYLMEKGVLHI